MSPRPRLLRRRPAPAGRHTRAVPGPLVPGAAAALVAAADPWDLPAAYAVEPDPDVEPDPAPEGAAARVPDPAVVATGPILLVPAAPPAPAVAAPAAPAPAAPPVPSGPSVSLGFADGELVDLPADDPRVRTFAAAAAALLEPHHR